MEDIRIGQLIAPFGPGALYSDSRGVSVIIAGLDHWFAPSCNDGNLYLDEFAVFEPRLSALLRVDRFRRPADYRGDYRQQNAKISTPVLRFPRWYREVTTGHLKKFNLETGRVDRGWVPVRFIAACKAGHLGDFPWKEWIKCQCQGEEHLYLHDSGGADLSGVFVECRSCGRRRSLAGVTWFDEQREPGEQSTFQKAGIQCQGYRPWLGDVTMGEPCQSPLVGALINQSSLYFAKVMSSISLPDLTIENDEDIRLRNDIETCEANLGSAKTLWRMHQEESAVDVINGALERIGVHAERERIRNVLEMLFSVNSHEPPNNNFVPEQPEERHLSFRREEFNILRTGINDDLRSPDLRIIPTEVQEDISRWIGKVHLVERLRETRAFYGFSRLQPDDHPLDDMPDRAMRQLFLHPPQDNLEKWLPAVTVYGEGLYIELSEKAISDWIEANLHWLDNRLKERFRMSLANVPQVLAPSTGATLEWTARYLLVHSLSHILINQMVFEAGYSSAALKERLYVSADNVAPMAGMLIYTAAGDSEGTLGGLVRIGHKDRLGQLIKKAVSRASWCSSDPVCSENLGRQGTRLANLAACHACIMLPETACETINNGLDRAMAVGTPDAREHGFFNDLLQKTA